MNWILRFKNKTTLVALIAAVVAFVYQGFALFGFVPAISSEAIIEWAGLAVNILVILGIVVDPTTNGVKDSGQAMNYEEPRKDA